jgi:hypothetical protein
MLTITFDSMRILLLSLLLATSLYSQAQVRPVFEIPLDFDQQWIPAAYDTLKTTQTMLRADGSGIVDTVRYKYIVFRNNLQRVDSAWRGYRFVFSNGTIFIDTFFIDQRAIGTHYGDSSVYIEQEYGGSTQGWQNRYRLSVHYNSGNHFDRYYREYYQTTGGWDGQITRYNLLFNTSNYYTGYERWSKSATTPYTLNRTVKRTLNGSMPVKDSLCNMPNSVFLERIEYTTNGNQITRADVFNDTASTGYALFSNNANNRIYKMEFFQYNSPNLSIFEFLGDAVSSGIKPTVEGNAGVYPNPCSNECALTWKTQGTVQSLISITDMCGRTLYRFSVNGNSCKIPTQSWPAGCYFYSIETEGNTLTGKILKN